VLDEHAREEQHGEALAGPLGMPDDTTATVTTDACGGQCRQQRLVGSMELMIGGDLLTDFSTIILKGDEVPQ